MNTEKQDGYFGRIKMTAEQDAAKTPFSSLGSCTLFSYAESPSSFFIAKITYLLLICVLMFGCKVTENHLIFAMPVKALLLVCLFLPPLASACRWVFGGVGRIDGVFPLLTASFLLLLDAYVYAVLLLVLFHLLDTLFFLLLSRVLTFSFPSLPLTPMKLVRQSVAGKCSVGDTVMLVAGDFVPADGRIESGKCTAASRLFASEEKQVFRVGDVLPQGFVLLDGSVQIVLTALPSTSYFSLYRNRLYSLTLSLLHQNKPARLTFLLTALIFLSGMALSLFALLGILTPARILWPIFVLSLLSLPWPSRFVTLLTLRALRRMLDHGFIPSTASMITASFPYGELKSVIERSSTAGEDDRIAVKAKGEKRIVSSIEEPLGFIAAKRHAKTVRIALTPYSTAGLSEGAAVFHTAPLPSVTCVCRIHRRLRRGLFSFWISFGVVSVLSVGLFMLPLPKAVALLPLASAAALALMISQFVGRDTH